MTAPEWTTGTYAAHNEALRGAERTMWRMAFGGIETLNNENARITAAQSASVSADTYNANEAQRAAELAELSRWRSGVDASLTQNVTRGEVTAEGKVGRRGSIDTTTKVVSVVIAAVVMLLLLATYQAARDTGRPPAPVTVTVPAP